MSVTLYSVGDNVDPKFSEQGDGAVGRSELYDTKSDMVYIPSVYAYLLRLKYKKKLFSLFTYQLWTRA